MDTSPTSIPPNRRTGARSATLVLVLPLCVVMSFGTATLTMLFAKQSVVKRAIEVEEAFVAAEASVDLAMSELLHDKDYGGDGIGVVSGGAGRASFTATLVPPFTGPQAYTILATGTVGSISRGIEVEVEPGAASGPGFLGLDSISMSGGVVDTWDSRNGTYASQAADNPRRAGTDARIQSNGDITLSGSAMVHGQATPGPGKTVTDVTRVSGSTAPATSALVADPIVYAPPIAAIGSVSGSITLGTGRYRYSAFLIGGGKVATIAGDVELWVDGRFEISGSGMAVLKPGARLCIHHGSDRFTISGSGFVNQDQKPAHLTVRSATTSAVTCAGDSEFFGTIAAPKAPLTASGGACIYGSVVAKTLTLSGGASLHYDKALGAGTAAYRRRLSWPSGGASRRS